VSESMENILVISLEQAVAAPYCTSRLADAGARVIKVERAEGDFARYYDDVVKQQSAYFVWLNRGKESIVLNIKDPDDLRLIREMIARADVFVQNLAPGAAARAGLDSAELRRSNPKLITVDISGYGESGPYSRMKAYDLLVQGETGLASITGSRDQPGRVGVSVCDIACGMYAHTAILQALLDRNQTGLGQGIKVSLFDSLADWMTVPLLHFDYGGKAPERVGLNHPTLAPYGAYRCRNEQLVIFSIQNEREWIRFCATVLQQPGLAEDPRFHDNKARCAHRDALDESIDAVLSALPRPDVIERLAGAGIAYGALNDVADFSAHPQLRRMTVETAEGAVEVVAPPAQTSRNPASDTVTASSVRKACVPALGQHTAAIRNEFSGNKDV